MQGSCGKALAGAAAIVFSLSGAAQHTQPAIKGAGANFPALIYQQWAAAYARESGVALTYTATGSGDGIKQARARSVDFGGTDSPLDADALAKAQLIQIPTVVGAIVPVVNLPGVASGALRLDGPTLADIFGGQIKQWNDARIAALNPSLRLPALPITRLVRADESGSTETFTRYLAATSPAWKGKASKKVDWNGAVTAAKGTDGVTEALLRHEGSIGYVSYDRVQKQRLAAVALKNADGQFALPSERSMQAAVRGSGLVDNPFASLLNARGADAWPIAELTYVLIPSDAQRAAAAGPTLQFFAWALQKGDAIVRQTGFVALPMLVQASAFKTLLSVRGADGKMLSVKL